MTERGGAERKLRDWIEGTARLAAELEREAGGNDRVLLAAKALHRAAIIVELSRDGYPMSVHLGGELVVALRGDPGPLARNDPGVLARSDPATWSARQK